MSTISVTSINDGDAVTAASINNQVNTIVNDYNGNITAANLAANAVTDAKITANNLLTSKFSNLYKFSVYRNTAWTSGGALTLVQFDTKTYDTSSNVDVVTNKGRFTAPVAGFYHFSAHVTSNTAANAGISTGLYKNGSAIKVSAFVGGGNTAQMTMEINGDIQLAINDYVEVYHQGSVSTGATGAANTYFDGYLISAI